MNTRLIPLALALTLSSPLVARADAPAPEGRLNVDIEIDPIAFVLDGFSLHAGINRGRFRLDLGAFAMALPRAMHGNDAFSAGFDGFGAKLQYFVLEEQKGLFVGVGAGIIRARIQHEGTGLGERQTRVGLGPQVGWRFNLPAGFFVTPWVGVDYSFGAHDVTIEGDTFDGNPWTVFPTVHLGRRF